MHCWVQLGAVGCSWVQCSAVCHWGGVGRSCCGQLLVDQSDRQSDGEGRKQSGLGKLFNVAPQTLTPHQKGERLHCCRHTRSTLEAHSEHTRSTLAMSDRLTDAIKRGAAAASQRFHFPSTSDITFGQFLLPTTFFIVIFPLLQSVLFHASKLTRSFVRLPKDHFQTDTQHIFQHAFLKHAFAFAHRPTHPLSHSPCPLLITPQLNFPNK